MAVNIKQFSYYRLFLEALLPEGSRSWIDYEVGKRLLEGLPPDEYERGIEELTRHLCL